MPDYINPRDYNSEHYMVLPAPKFWNSPAQNNFEISFSGIAVLEGFKGNEDGTWKSNTLLMKHTDMQMSKIVDRVKSSLPALPAGPNRYEFVPLQWTVFATINSQFDNGHSVNAGFAANNFKLSRSSVRISESTNQQKMVFSGLFIDLAVRDRDAIIYRVGYSLNMYGYFTNEYVPPIS